MGTVFVASPRPFGHQGGMSLIERIREANDIDETGLLPFVADGRTVGLALADFAQNLAEWPDVFRIDGGVLALEAGLRSPAERTAAVARPLAALRDAGVVTGWRNELYPVVDMFGDEPVLEVERAAATLLGIKTFAVNLNGYVENGDEAALWLQHRAKTKPTSPDKLDVLVSGGQPTNISPFDNLIKECGEEAGIPESVARQAQDAGWIGFRARRPDGVNHGHYFNYDLALPDDFEPINTDGEVQAFYRWPIGKVIDILSNTQDIAFDSAVVIIDFLIRHGHIAPDTPDYATIRESLQP